MGRLRGRGIEPQVYTYATGHASYDVEERIRQTAVVLDFLARTVPGVRRLEGLDALLPAAAVLAWRPRREAFRFPSPR